MEDVSNNNENSQFYDIRKVFPLVDKNLLDKMHFNRSGCEIFTTLVGNYISKNYPDTSV